MTLDLILVSILVGVGHLYARLTAVTVGRRWCTSVRVLLRRVIRSTPCGSLAAGFSIFFQLRFDQLVENEDVNDRVQDKEDREDGHVRCLATCSVPVS